MFLDHGEKQSWTVLLAGSRLETRAAGLSRSMSCEGRGGTRKNAAVTNKSSLPCLVVTMLSSRATCGLLLRQIGFFTLEGQVMALRTR